jgi:hypothetical protein
MLYCFGGKKQKSPLLETCIFWVMSRGAMFLVCPYLAKVKLPITGFSI